MERMTIIGLGLIGGSLGLALKATKLPNVEIVGYDTDTIAAVDARRRRRRGQDRAHPPARDGRRRDGDPRHAHRCHAPGDGGDGERLAGELRSHRHRQHQEPRDGVGRPAPAPACELRRWPPYGRQGDRRHRQRRRQALRRQGLLHCPIARRHRERGKAGGGPRSPHRGAAAVHRCPRTRPLRGRCQSSAPGAVQRPLQPGPQQPRLARTGGPGQHRLSRPHPPGLRRPGAEPRHLPHQSRGRPPLVGAHGGRALALPRAPGGGPGGRAVQALHPSPARPRHLRHRRSAHPPAGGRRRARRRRTAGVPSRGRAAGAARPRDTQAAERAAAGEGRTPPKADGRPPEERRRP